MRSVAKAARIAAMLANKAVMDPPRNVFDDLVKNDSLTPHGLAPFRIQMPRKQLETSRINVVRPFKHKLCRTGVGLTRAFPSRACVSSAFSSSRPSPEMSPVDLIMPQRNQQISSL